MRLPRGRGSRSRTGNRGPVQEPIMEGRYRKHTPAHVRDPLYFFNSLLDVVLHRQETQRHIVRGTPLMGDGHELGGFFVEFGNRQTL